MTDSRYDRQARLAEVGSAGQERLERASAEISGRDGATIELAYLCRAGIAEVSLVPGKHPVAFAHADWFRFASPRRIAAGAWRALEKIKAALEPGTR